MHQGQGGLVGAGWWVGAAALMPRRLRGGCAGCHTQQPCIALQMAAGGIAWSCLACLQFALQHNMLRQAVDPPGAGRLMPPPRQHLAPTLPPSPTQTGDLLPPVWRPLRAHVGGSWHDPGRPAGPNGRQRQRRQHQGGAAGAEPWQRPEAAAGLGCQGELFFLFFCCSII